LFAPRFLRRLASPPGRRARRKRRQISTAARIRTSRLQATAAIREDCSINLAAIAEMKRKFQNLDLILLESGGDNLAATFSPELVDLAIHVIDVAGGEKIPRKGGPGITKSAMLVVNKTDLAPLVGADLGVMEADTRRMRPTRPYVMASIRNGVGVREVADFIIARGGLPGG